MIFPITLETIRHAMDGEHGVKEDSLPEEHSRALLHDSVD